jgi:hypothetical protein
MSKRYRLFFIAILFVSLKLNTSAGILKNGNFEINSIKEFDIQSISVFGTDLITSEDIASNNLEVINELLELNEVDKEKFNIKKEEFEQELKSKFDFSYTNLHIFKDYVGKVFLIFDFVSKADSSSRLQYRNVENLTFTDPDHLIAKWREYEQLSFELFNAGEIKNTDCPIYHCVWGYDHPKLQPYFEYFEEFVPKNKFTLIEILNRSDSAEFRANAAFLLAHLNVSASELEEILEDAINDPSTHVRNNSMRVIYYLVNENPELELDLDKVVQALNYPSNYDRNKAIVILRSIPLDRLTKSQIAMCLPVLLRCIEENDNNASNAHRVLKLFSGEQFSRYELEKWRAWCTNYLLDNPDNH